MKVIELIIRAELFCGETQHFASSVARVSFQRVNVKSRINFFFKSSKSKTVLIWHCINLLYIASESLNDALTEVNFFNKSDTKKNFGRQRCKNLKNTVCEYCHSF